MTKASPKKGWYIGNYRSRNGLYECCYGFVKTGYWSYGRDENEPYSHMFWGFVWAGKYTIGVGRIVCEDLLKEGRE